MKKWILIILAIVVLTGVGFGVYYFYSKPEVIVNQDNGELATSTDDTLPVKNLEYKNDRRGFSLNYPDYLTYKEYKESDEAYTIVFQNKLGDRSFQIFFTPYLGDKITDARIKMDIPDGKVMEPVEIVLNGGIHALAFFSNQQAGELREVWFIRNGFLYEVSTFKDLDTWLADIMKSWHFNNQ